jgi:hypothetical protein
MSAIRKPIPPAREVPLSEIIVSKPTEQSDDTTSINVVLTKSVMIMVTVTLACMTLVLAIICTALLSTYHHGYGNAVAAYDALLPAMQHMNHTVANLDDASANARLVSHHTLHAASDGLPAANRLLIEGAELAHAMREIASKPTMNLRFT